MKYLSIITSMILLSIILIGSFMSSVIFLDEKFFLTNLTFLPKGAVKLLENKDFSTPILKRLETSGIAIIFLGISLWVTSKSWYPKLVHLFREPSTINSSPQRLYSWMRRYPFQFTFLLAIILIALTIRMEYLFNPMSYDEAYTVVFYAKGNISNILCNYFYPNNHILHSIILYLIQNSWGDSEVFMRLPAFISGILIIPSVFLLGYKLGEFRVAALASALCAMSPLQIDYSTNARGYSIIALLTIWIYIIILNFKNNYYYKNLFLLTIFAVLSLYTIPVSLYSLAPAFIYLAISSLNKDSSKSFPLISVIISGIIVGCFTIIAYLPVIIIGGTTQLLNNRFMTKLSWDQFLKSFPDMSQEIFIFWTSHMSPILIGFLIIGLIMNLFSSKSRKLFLLILLVPLAILFIQKSTPPSRAFFSLLPLVLTLSAYGLIELTNSLFIKKHLASPFIYLMFGLISLQGFTLLREQPILGSGGPFPEGPDMALWFKEHLMPGDRIAAPCPSHAPLKYYFSRLGLNPDIVALTRNDLMNNQRIYITAVDDFRLERHFDLLKRLNIMTEDPLLIHTIERSKIFIFIPSQ